MSETLFSGFPETSEARVDAMISVGLILIVGGAVVGRCRCLHSFLMRQCCELVGAYFVRRRYGGWGAHPGETGRLAPRRPALVEA